MTFSKPLIDGFGKCNFRVTTSQNNVESVKDGHCAELIKDRRTLPPLKDCQFVRMSAYLRSDT
ncbi:hypothetical protein Tcan_14852 [Toxocara canis]|uniref:Uncharacterized protein n=1 Tax=Toxocara canis TaxID=6265 RepID=A0A0B2VKV9_TOXCA|nr:hypothetical protein Tcan_14852 [Toxocara canis]